MWSSRKNIWLAHIAINGTQTPFKLDTGTEVTAISKEVWQTLGAPTLQPSSKQLFGPAQYPLKVQGQFLVTSPTKGRKLINQSLLSIS